MGTDLTRLAQAVTNLARLLRFQRPHSKEWQEAMRVNLDHIATYAPAMHRLQDRLQDEIKRVSEQCADLILEVDDLQRQDERESAEPTGIPGLDLEDPYPEEMEN